MDGRATSLSRRDRSGALRRARDVDVVSRELYDVWRCVTVCDSRARIGIGSRSVERRRRRREAPVECARSVQSR